MITRIEIQRHPQNYFIVTWCYNDETGEKCFATLLGAVLWIAEQEGFATNEDFGEIFPKDQ